MNSKFLNTASRVPFLLLGIASLVAGVWGGLVRLPLNLPLPGGNAGWLTFHGPLMVCGFLGTVIALERAVGLKSWWIYVPPVLIGVGSLMFVGGKSGSTPPILILVGSILFWVVTLKVVKMQPVAFTIVMSAGALLWVVGNALWLYGTRQSDSNDWPIPRIVPWWICFLALTILGERLDLSRFQKPSKWSQPLLNVVFLVTAAALGVCTAQPLWGERLLGFSLLGMAAWLGRFDIARRTVKNPGLSRFMASALLIGYFWMAVSGVLMVCFAPLVSGLKYDAVLHSFFVGFVFSMIFAHAPVIFPAVLVVQPAFSERFYVHVAMLELGLLLRVSGDLFGSAEARKWGAVLNALAVLVFLLSTVSALVFRSPVQKKKVAA